MELDALKKEARNQQTPLPRLLELAGMDPQLSRLLAQVKHAPAPLLEALSRNSDAPTRARVAAHPSTPVATLENLSWDRNATVLKAVAQHPRTPDAILERLSGHKQAGVRAALLERWPLRVPLPTQVLERLLADPALTARAVWRFGRQLSTEQVEALLQSSDGSVRSSTAAHAPLEQTQFEVLLADPDPWVRGALAANPTVHGDSTRLERVLEHPDDDTRLTALQCWQIEGPHAEALLERFVSDLNPVLRAAAAGQRALSPDQLGRLLCDPFPGARNAADLAANFGVTPFYGVRERLAQQDDAWVQACVAACSRVSGELLETLASSRFPEVRFLVAAHPFTPEEVLERLTFDALPQQFQRTDDDLPRSIAELAQVQLSDETLSTRGPGQGFYHFVDLERVFGGEAP